MKRHISNVSRLSTIQFDHKKFNLHLILFIIETFDLYCIARTDNDTHNEFTSIIISNSDNPFWNENFTLDSRVVFKALKFTVWMAYKSATTGEVVNMPIGKVLLSIFEAEIVSPVSNISYF